MIFRIIGSLCAAAVLNSAQAPPPDTAKEKAKVEGRVTSQSTGEPLRKATVRLQMQPSQGVVVLNPRDIATYTSSSDAEGKFVFEDIEPGRYTLSAERAGFVRQTYGARSATTAGTPLTLSAGQHVKELVFKLMPQGVIAGKVTDEDGDPIGGGVQLRVYRYGYSRGRRQLQPTGAATMNADGTFTVGGLAPGRYYLSATDNRAMMIGGPRERPGRKGPEEGYVTTYFPNALEPSAAAPIDVLAGSEIRGIEIRLRKAQVFHISGKVEGNSAPNTILMLVPRDTTGNVMVFNPVGAMVREGSFEFNHVMPGTYIIQANPGVSINGEKSGGLMARYVVTVSDQSLENIVVPLISGSEISGSIKTEGVDPQPRPTARPNIILSAMEGVNFTTANAQAKDDGTFQLRGIVPDKFRVNIYNLPDGTYVKSIRFGGQEVSQTGLDLTSGSGGTLDILLSPNAADVSGVVHNADGGAVSGVAVSLWSPGHDADPPKMANTDQNGGFRIRGLAPGEYRVVAWEDIEPGLAQDADFRKHFESQATSMTLHDGSHENSEVKLISKDAIEAEAARVR